MKGWRYFFKGSFYKPNAMLTGYPVSDEMVDLEQGDLLVPQSGYSSHWWSEDELRALFNKYEGLDVKCEIQGCGIFITVRKLRS